jgi:hypothetical protein
MIVTASVKSRARAFHLLLQARLQLGDRHFGHDSKMTRAGRAARPGNNRVFSQE